MVENQRMLHCEQVWREISNYVDGDVDAALRSSMEEHFRTCQRCASVLAGTRNVIQLYGMNACWKCLLVSAGGWRSG
jgi:hypothetical protein